MKLTVYHAYENSVRWRLTPRGVEIEGSGVERTKGAPATVTRVWERFSDEINRTARARRVPCALIIACICTESGGRPDSVRLEPGYKSDEETPHRVSPGLMQTLISTAREAVGRRVDREWLLVPGNSIEAGTAYIAKQFKQTGFDPPLVGAAYNAGSLRHQDGSQNRWKLRQYPIGTSKHCDRFVQFFNDAVYVLANHS
ncbi:MAG TPA: transglycosylase SLT domain-containing protein, partial [Pyrinomonadaceae bacterium]|nr:transglycosylase SLT domain-containing protein [Pyrinomonadaceae bacterium]